MPDSTSGGCPPGEQSFEACLAELQNMVRLLEDGTLGLAESIAGFERGIALLRHCYRTLEQAEQKIEILSGFDQAGNAVTAPFDAAATLETGQGTAGRRRKKPACADALNRFRPVAERPVPSRSPNPNLGLTCLFLTKDSSSKMTPRSGRSKEGVSGVGRREPMLRDFPPTRHAARPVGSVLRKRPRFHANILTPRRLCCPRF